MSNDSDFDEFGRYWRIPKWFPDLTEKTHLLLRSYLSELIHFNGRMNLISPRTEKFADQIHFADGILGSRIVLGMTAAPEIYDIGSGNGIPGLILATLDQGRRVILVDADARKIEFLKHCISRLGIKNCSTIHARLEDLPQRSIHCVVNRAFASISKSLLLSRKAAAEDCSFFHFKGHSWSSEVADIPSQILASWDPMHVKDYALPESETVLSIVLTKRVSR